MTSLAKGDTPSVSRSLVLTWLLALPGLVPQPFLYRGIHVGIVGRLTAYKRSRRPTRVRLYLSRSDSPMPESSRTISLGNGMLYSLDFAGGSALYRISPQVIECRSNLRRSAGRRVPFREMMKIR
ncbi:hypothetical protein C8Q78DRAFT_732139 [Trametes maxima]|nr:hypothetical protein C8Q78DRAFT_732139 [Trametes maxima]